MKPLLQTPSDWTLTWLRVAVGLAMLPHGAQKLLGWFGGGGVDGTVGLFQSQFGLPPAVSLLVILTESVGALLLIVGLGGRFAAGALIVNMVGAITLVNAGNGYFWTAQGYEFPLFLITVTVVILVRGSGAWSLDRLVLDGKGTNTPATPGLRIR